MGNDSEHAHDGSQGEERERRSALKPPASPMSQRTSSRGRAKLHVDVSRLSQSAGALDCTHPPLYSPLASPFAPDLSTMEVDSLPLSFLPTLPHLFWMLVVLFLGECRSNSCSSAPACVSILIFNRKKVVFEEPISSKLTVRMALNFVG